MDLCMNNLSRQGPFIFIFHYPIRFISHESQFRTVRIVILLLPRYLWHETHTVNNLTTTIVILVLSLFGDAAGDAKYVQDSHH